MEKYPTLLKTPKKNILFVIKSLIIINDNLSLLPISFMLQPNNANIRDERRKTYSMAHLHK
jgi:hypothetical protein